MRSNSLGLLAVAIVTASLFLGVVFLERSSSLPPDFQFESHFSRRQAEMFYDKARQVLRQSYWERMRQNLKNRQFKDAWNRCRNGAGHLEGVIPNSNSDAMAYVKFRNGDSFWMTLQSGSGGELANALAAAKAGIK